MNLRGLLKKLQTALLTVGVVVKVNTEQWYSAEQNRIINCYRISTPVSTKITRKNQDEWVKRDHEILKTFSPVEVVQCLGDIYKELKNDES